MSQVTLLKEKLQILFFKEDMEGNALRAPTAIHALSLGDTTRHMD